MVEAMEDTKITFRVPKELHNQAMEKAKREDITLSQVLRRCLRQWVAEDAQPEEKSPDKD
jgi:predicted HicB family RNase H-like nuclease